MNISIIPQIQFADTNNFFLIAGPCAIEGEEMAFNIASRLKEITTDLKIPFIFKGSYKKANRTRLDSFTGIGDKAALEILGAIRKDLAIPVTTDIHTEEEAALAAKYVDVLQIPAFLCRQTDLLVAAAKTGKVVNVKKGQFLSPQAMCFAQQKIIDSGNVNVLLTERGTMMGYKDLVVDYRSIPIMQSFGAKVVLDCTHSLQLPNQIEGVTGGQPDMIEAIAKAGVAVGVDGLFIETHHNPGEAKSDGKNMLKLDLIDSLLRKLVNIRNIILNN